MARVTIHVARIGPDDWVVRHDSGRELGNYPSQDAAAEVGRKVARKHRAELTIHDQSRKTHFERPAMGWFARLLGR